MISGQLHDRVSGKGAYKMIGIFFRFKAAPVSGGLSANVVFCGRGLAVSAERDTIATISKRLKRKYEFNYFIEQ